MERKYEEYIKQVIDKINADRDTKNKIRLSLTEHIEVLIEKHGSLAYNKLDSAEKVAREFSENLNLKGKQDSYPWWYKRGFRRKVSEKRIFNLPLYHITDGYNPETGKFEIARGIFAIGPVALGFLSWGGLSLGLISFGGLSVGILFALGGMALSMIGALGGMVLGGLLAVGGLAFSFGLSIGGLAIGHIAIGGEVFGEYVYNVNSGEGNAVEWFMEYLPFFVKYF